MDGTAAAMARSSRRLAMSAGIGTMSIELPGEKRGEAPRGPGRPHPERSAPRWPAGSWARIGHGAVLALALRVSMVAVFVAGGVLLGVSRDMEEVDGRA